MATNIFIPKKIKVGFQTREDTYTKKLAYVIYYDQKNKLRKENSWNSWRDKKIEPEDYDNEPTTGFVLNKKVGGYQYHYDMRQTYVRVFDPRGFEFEITIPNLLYILENTSSIKGKGLEGEFVYGWDGKDLLLIPTSAPEYQEMQKMANNLYEGEAIKAKDLILGATYGTANGSAYVYMGKSDYWTYERNYYYEDSDWNRRYGKVGWSDPLDDTWETNIAASGKDKFKNINKGKRFWFIDAEGHICSYSTISKKFYSVIDSNVTEKFAEYQDLLDNDRDYSPMNYSAAKIIPLTFEEFKEFVYTIKDSSYGSYDNYSSIRCYRDGEWHSNRVYKVKDNNTWYYEKSEKVKSGRYEYCQTVKVNGALEELYEQLKPARAEQYLMNGKLYKGWC